MAAETLNCPMCGAAASTDSTRCEHCGARLATVACPSCFGMMFLGEKFCSHCGAKAQRAEVQDDADYQCPRCKVGLAAVVIGKNQLRECPRCGGIWADVDALEQICADREEQAAVLGVAAPLPQNPSGELEQVRYLPCPICRKLMNRVNFAHCSQVIVDVCKGHGTWFDKDELRRIVEFIRAGGLEAARDRELSEIEERRRALAAAEMARSMPYEPASGSDHYRSSGLNIGISAAAELLRDFFLKR